MSILSSILGVFRNGSSVRSARASQRYAVATPARLRPSDTIGVAWENVILDNLSLGGARVLTSLRLTSKSKIDLVLSLGGDREIEVKARVVFVRAKGFQAECGLRFLELSYERYQALIAYINEREEGLKAGLSHPRQSQHA